MPSDMHNSEMAEATGLISSLISSSLRLEMCLYIIQSSYNACIMVLTFVFLILCLYSLSFSITTKVTICGSAASLLQSIKAHSPFHCDSSIVGGTLSQVNLPYFHSGDEYSSYSSLYRSIGVEFSKIIIEHSTTTLENRLALKIVFILFFFIIVGQPYSQNEEKKP